MPFAATMTLKNSKIKPCGNPGDARMISVRLPGGVNYLAGQVLEEVVGGTATNAVHTLTFGGTVSGGSFTLTYITAYGPKATSAIAYNATAATLVANIQAALDALLGAGNTVVAGTGPFTITYQNDLGALPLAIPTATNNLTGTSPTITPSSTTTGQFPGSYHQALNAGVAKCILEADEQTDMAGNRITEHGVASQDVTVPAWNRGEFTAYDASGVLQLPGLTSTAAGQLGKFIRGSFGNPSSILRIT